MDNAGRSAGPGILDRAYREGGPTIRYRRILRGIAGAAGQWPALVGRRYGIGGLPAVAAQSGGPWSNGRCLRCRR